MLARALLCLILVSAPLWAQGPARMVRDIKAEAQSKLVEFGTPAEFVAFDGFVYFSQNEGVHGFEVWRWSPATGAELFVDVCPGACWSSPFEFTEWKGRLYFAASGSAAGRELWSTDGTREGTGRLADIAPGLESSSPAWLTATPGALYFVAQQRQNDGELWKTDGSLTGTERVADILAGPAGAYPMSLTYGQDVLCFSADDGVHGREPWCSDGTASGTSLLADLCPGPDPCVDLQQPVYKRNRGLAFVGDRLMVELRQATGSEYGLASVALDSGDFDLLEPSPRGAFHTFTRFGEALLFVSYEHPEGALWRTDGTPQGTLPIVTLEEEPRVLGVLGKLAYFVVLSGREYQLWGTDGTGAGTSFVATLGEAAVGIAEISTTPGIDLGERLLFRSSIEGFGAELWATDGTTDGTVLVQDSRPGPSGAFFDLWFPTTMTILGSDVVYRGWGDFDGWEPWRSDGTDAGTMRIADLFAPSDGIVAATLDPPFLQAAPLDEVLLFAADDGVSGAELWRTDGSEEQTHLVTDLVPGDDDSGFPRGSYPRPRLGVGGVGFVGTQLGVLSTTGEVGEVDWLADSNSFSRFVSLPQASAAVDARVFFGGLYESDGSAAGTSMVGDNVDSFSLAAVDARLFVTKFDEATGQELWVVEGDPGVVVPVADINPGPEGSDPAPVAYFQGRYLFSADDGESGRELWISDGTSGGTMRVRDVWPGEPSSSPSTYEIGRLPAVTPAGAFFVADDGSSGRELWFTDATEFGTRRVADIRPGPSPSDPSDLVVAGGNLFFLANDGIHGRELWVARGDGTRARMVVDLAKGPASSTPARRLSHELEAVGGRVYFGATDGRDGVELWTSDGTAGGTRRLQDLNPGPGSSSPGGFVVAGSCLYFSANDGEHGFELWALPIDPVSGDVRHLGQSGESSCSSSTAVSGSSSGESRRKSSKAAAPPPYLGFGPRRLLPA